MIIENTLILASNFCWATRRWSPQNNILLVGKLKAETRQSEMYLMQGYNCIRQQLISYGIVHLKPSSIAVLLATLQHSSPAGVPYGRVFVAREIEQKIKGTRNKTE
jgi:hypothetical protein